MNLSILVNMNSAPTKHNRNKGILIWLVISQLLALGSLLSVIAFDSGESAEAWAIVIAVWASPLISLIMAFGAWIAYTFRKNKLAAVLSGLSFAPPILLCILLWIASVIGL